MVMVDAPRKPFARNDVCQGKFYFPEIKPMVAHEALVFGGQHCLLQIHGYLL